MENIVNVVTVCSGGLKKGTAEFSSQRQSLFLGDLQRHKHEKMYSVQQVAVTTVKSKWASLAGPRSSYMDLFPEYCPDVFFF